MAEIRTVTTLRSKRDEIERAIAHYEARLAQARADLTHINAAIALFDVSSSGEQLAPYVDLHRLFKYGEMVTICIAALQDGPKNTREIAVYAIKVKRLDTGDAVLRKALSNRFIHTLRRMRRDGRITSAGRHKAAHIWRLRA